MTCTTLASYPLLHGHHTSSSLGEQVES